MLPCIILNVTSRVSTINVLGAGVHNQKFAFILLARKT